MERSEKYKVELGPGVKDGERGFPGQLEPLGFVIRVEHKVAVVMHDAEVR